MEYLLLLLTASILVLIGWCIGFINGINKTNERWQGVLIEKNRHIDMLKGYLDDARRQVIILQSRVSEFRFKRGLE